MAKEENVTHKKVSNLFSEKCDNPICNFVAFLGVAQFSLVNNFHVSNIFFIVVKNLVCMLKFNKLKTNIFDITWKEIL